jgi:hypothetical protein
MAERYAPALFLEVLAFWFVLRWFLAARLVLFFGRALVLLMLVGVLGTLDQRRFVWAACFAGLALLAWLLVRPWRARPTRRRLSLPILSSLVWRGKSADEVAMLCERRIGLKVGAATPATVTAAPLSADPPPGPVRRGGLEAIGADRDQPAIVRGHAGQRHPPPGAWPQDDAAVAGCGATATSIVASRAARVTAWWGRAPVL